METAMRNEKGSRRDLQERGRRGDGKERNREVRRRKRNQRRMQASEKVQAQTHGKK
jgi:hypothetical protein